MQLVVVEVVEHLVFHLRQDQEVVLLVVLAEVAAVHIMLLVAVVVVMPVDILLLKVTEVVMVQVLTINGHLAEVAVVTMQKVLMVVLVLVDEAVDKVVVEQAVLIVSLEQ